MPKSKNSKPGGARVPKRLAKPLRKAIAFLDEIGYRYAIIGGIALSQWGVIRATQDVDIKVLVPDSDYDKIIAALLSKFPKRARLHAPRNPLILALEIDNVIVDFLFTIPGYEEQIITRAVRRNLNGLQAWICTAEDLIIQKVVANRGKDWSDIELLLIEQRGKLDDAYIDDWLTQFAEALEMPEMLAEYQRLAEKIKNL